VCVRAHAAFFFNGAFMDLDDGVVLCPEEVFAGCAREGWMKLHALSQNMSALAQFHTG